MIKVISYGGGVQSTALLVLAVQGKIDYKTFLFCNVGDDSEKPETIDYVHSIAMPYAKDNGIELIELQKTLRSGEKDTLYGRLLRGNTPDIPVHFGKSALGPGMAQRSCTNHFKIRVVDKWLKAKGAKQEGALVGLGISMDEFQRVKPNMNPETIDWKEHAFPLIDMRLDRQDCMNIISKVGLHVPPKSSCWFCPFNRIQYWQEMRNKQPDLFQKGVDLEKVLNEKRDSQGKNRVWLTRRIMPLTQATTHLKQHSLFEEDVDDICESGYCFM